MVVYEERYVKIYIVISGKVWKPLPLINPIVLQCGIWSCNIYTGNRHPVKFIPLKRRKNRLWK